MAKAIGIDLGTTNSCVVVMEAGNPVVIPNPEGARTTPSVVAFTEQGDRLTGNIAKRQAVTNPVNTIVAIKRLLGRKFNSPEVQRSSQYCAYDIQPARNGDANVKVFDRLYAPPEIAAIVLEQMRSYAEEYLGERVEDAVVTVPAYFDDAQRQATRDAGRIAGLNVIRIINEPTAAALAFGMNRYTKGRVAVYDLGGGTFDISVLDVGEGVFQVKSTHGDTFLGGEDADARILQLLVNEFMEEHGVDLRDDPIALQRLKEAAEKAKIELSTAQDTDINLPFTSADETGPKHLQRSLTRAECEGILAEMVEKTIWHCEQALGDANLNVDDIDEVILVGGMTKIPAVQRAVSDFFGMTPNRGVNPDEAVAVGAAIQASILKGEVENVLLLDVIPLSLGIETQGSIFTRLIERNRTIPTSCSEIFTTAEDYQSIVNIHVLQGERAMAKDNKSLARFELVGIPPARRGVPKIEVTFDVDVNGILSVSAKDLGTGNEQSVRIRATSGLTEREIERLTDEAESFRQTDYERKEMAGLKNKADGLIYTTERSLSEFINYLTDDEIQQINEDLERCKTALEGEDTHIIRNAIKNLEKSSYKIAEVMYREVQ